MPRPGARGTRFLWAIGLLAGTLILGWSASDLDARTRPLLWTTLRLGGFTALVSVPLGTLLAVLVHRTDTWGRRLAWAILVAWLFVPLYLQAAGWDAWFGRQGWIWPAQDSPGRRLAAAIWIHSAAAIPWVAIIVGAGLRQLAPELEEAALLDMSPAGVLFRVTLPLSRPAILAAGWWAFAMTAGEMTVTDIYQVRTFAEEVYTLLPLVDMSGGETSGAALPRGTGLLAGAIFLSLLSLSQFAQYDSPPTVRHRLPLRLGPLGVPCSVILIGVVATITLAPLGNLCSQAGLEIVKSPSGSVTRSWSGLKFVTMVLTSPWHFYRELTWTLLIASGAATLAMLIAAPLAWAARRRTWAAWPMLIVTSVAVAVPGPVVALSIIRCLNRADLGVLTWLYDRTILAPILAASVRALPVAMLVCWWGCRTISPELIDMARIDGLGFFAQLRQLAWPLRKEMFLVGWCAALSVAAGDLGATLLVTPPGISTLSTRVFGLLHAGVDDQVAGICLMNCLLCLGLAVLAIRMYRQRD